MITSRKNNSSTASLNRFSIKARHLLWHRKINRIIIDTADHLFDYSETDFQQSLTVSCVLLCPCCVLWVGRSIMCLCCVRCVVAFVLCSVCDCVGCFVLCGVYWALRRERLLWCELWLCALCAVCCFVLCVVCSVLLPCVVRYIVCAVCCVECSMQCAVLCDLLPVAFAHDLLCEQINRIVQKKTHVFCKLLKLSIQNKKNTSTTGFWERSLRIQSQNSIRKTLQEVMTGFAECK